MFTLLFTIGLGAIGALAGAGAGNVVDNSNFGKSANCNMQNGLNMAQQAAALGQQAMSRSYS